MVQTAVTKVIQTLGDVHDRLGLSRSPAADFFLEWQQDLPELDSAARVADRVLRGRIDFLVMQDGFWQVVIESKETTFDIAVGIPQLLTYMMAAPSHQTGLFGMVTNGSSFVFVKLDRTQAQYDFSDVYTMLSRANPLYPVVQILQGLARRMTQRIV